MRADATFCYRSYDQLQSDLLAWLPHLPPVSGVAGVPRSGTIVAGMLAELLNVDFISLERLCRSAPAIGFRPRSYRTPRAGTGPILVIDDTCSTGRTMRQVRDYVRPNDVLFGAVYVQHPRRCGLDVMGYRIRAKYHTYAWNLFADGMGARLASDLDGVLCPDWPHATEDGERTGEYDEWLRTSCPLRVPQDRLAAIVTGRLERHRVATERWLATHGIRYGQLLMHPECDPRRRDPVGLKAKCLRDLGPSIVAFVESDPRQATTLAARTGRPVLCLTTHELHRGTGMSPLYGCIRQMDVVDRESLSPGVRGSL